MKLNRKGFAIVLVAALASLVFLLGASLVVVTRLQTAAASYDQNVRLARDHARAAFDMAMSELQEKLGPDKAVSYAADVRRPIKGDDFDEAVTGDLREPFWTAAKNGSTVSWLTTRGMDGGMESPINDYSDPEVTLVSNGNTVSSRALEVNVPKEAIRVAGVDGFTATDSKTIGHYGYWVGDLGIKASYAIRDTSAETVHDIYDEKTVDDGIRSHQERLSQLRIAKLGLDTVDTEDSVGANPSNPARIDAFVNDFQFRDRFGDTEEPEFYLYGLTENRVQEYFHDFTPLSKGLLVDPVNGGMRLDLSQGGTTGVDYLDAYFNLGKNSISTATDYTNDVFPMKANDATGPAIHPVLTQFNLTYALYLLDLGDSRSELHIGFFAGLEFWNPFTSAIEAESLRVEVSGLPSLQVGFSLKEWTGDLEALGDTRFITPPTVDEEVFWRPGQIVSYSGPAAKDASGEGPYLLSLGSGYLNDSASLVEIQDLDHIVEGSVDLVPYTFSEPANIVVELYLNDDPGTLLATYELPSSFTSGSPLLGSILLGEERATFGFSWEIDDDQIGVYENYNPFDGTLDLDALFSFDSVVDSLVNYNPSFEDASTTLLLGANPTPLEPDDAIDTSYDLPLLQLPKQELLAISHLNGAYGNEWGSFRLGEPEAEKNSLFDTHFFSGIGTDDGTWSLGDPIPNSGYVPRSDASEATLQSVDSADEFFVHGMFNVNSTSIEAWAALLKGSPASANAFWFDYFENLEGDEDTELNPELYLMFNYPQGAENTFVADLAPVETIDQARASVSQSMFVFEAADLDVLARHIVSNIRKRHQGVSPYNSEANGAFESLQGFVDSAVLKNAISDAHSEINVGGNSVFKPSWVKANSNREFRQSTILNLIAPYLSVRSDTFLIRAYGDAVDPSNPDKIWARAYCEAIVQRTHEPYDEDNPGLGRRFVIEAFRWLSPSEI
ncbi:hypothetical protein [Pelagicoccus sp. SDUM812002]|uniref:hypothetical protein n=1 Tax=Pelagicoccus sp. SDUM812002 TaxID=3041266 RepID=UPI0028100917|nr:hypothetical protein [Pelagicoccus sp. SDUM812002]MDQ8187563.1 hypothetical protein [Pelagicoccus sp. SDUM812002]